jgi:ribulose-5-phosphate 4-epimerase/fuculose-1-phosphate aldolase
MAVLLGNHGPIVCGRTLSEAATAVEILEKAAMSYIFGSLIGGCKTIPEEDVREERNRFLHRYGTKSDGALE